MEVNVYCFLTKSAYFPVSENLYTLFIYGDILLIIPPNRVIFLSCSPILSKFCLPKNSLFEQKVLTLQLEMTKR